HRALDRLVGSDPVDDLVEFVHHLLGEDVHRPVLHVPGDEGDAVGIDIDGEIVVVSHWSLSSLKTVASANERDDEAAFFSPFTGRGCRQAEEGRREPWNAGSAPHPTLRKRHY